jgi:NAD+ kinase
MRTIGILAHPKLDEAAPLLRELVGWLSERGVSVFVGRRTATLAGRLPDAACTVADRQEVAAHAEALVVLGGDGTLLRACRLLEGRPVPIVGVNFGSLGFLTEITLEELYPTLEGLLRGGYDAEERSMLRAVIERQGQPDTVADALNDVVVTKAALVSRIVELEVAVDGRFVSAFRADGLIVSTPTGSTAYNLAAGGPILHPSLRAMALTPICPHMLANRPLVIGDEATVSVSLSTGNVEVVVTVDGQEGVPLAPQDRVVITRSPCTLRLVRAPRDYFEVLRTKLKWGEARRLVKERG